MVGKARIGMHAILTMMMMMFERESERECERFTQTHIQNKVKFNKNMDKNREGERSPQSEQAQTKKAIWDRPERVGMRTQRKFLHFVAGNAPETTPPMAADEDI